DEVIVSFPYSAGTTRSTGPPPFTDYDSPVHGIVARANQVGTTWGLAYARSSRSLFSAAFMKKHTGFGSTGTGAIYRTDRNTNTVSVYTDVNAILGANAAGANPHNTADYDRDNGNTGWDAVGKVSFGGMAISEDETKLYTMNLASRQLLEIPLNAAPTAANIRTRAVPTNPPGCSNAGDVRPFAVDWYQNRIYVGMVCSAESTVSDQNQTGDLSQLRAYVYTVDPATLDFSAAPVFQMPLNYPRRCADSAQIGPPNCFAAAWRGWTPVYRNIGAEGRAIWPQPMLTGIGFDNGNLVLGFRDRAGDQFGNETLDNPGDNMRYYGVAAGDLIRACGNPASGWTLENNARCAGAGAGPQNTNQGPGGGEYYADGSEPFTDEVPMGGVLAIPGYPDVALTVFDPIPVFEGSSLFDGGVRWLSNTSGGYTKSYRVYDGIRAIIGSLGKANGLGDLDAFCDPAPVEIGNRIWRDLDGDGIQDANEPGIAGVTVALCDASGATIATAVTDASGNFYFSSGTGANTAAAIYGIAGLRPNTQGYKLKLSNPANFAPGGPLAGHNLSPMDAGGNSQDQRDSDAMVMNGVNVVPFNTGVAGANNHTFDFGFVPQSQPPTITCPPNQTAVATSANGAVVTYPPPAVTPATATVTCTPASGSTFPVGTTTVTCTATSGTITSSCSFTVTVGLQPTITCPPNPPAVTATGPNGAVVTYTPPTATPATAIVTCTPASGSTFPVGTTTVNCTATSGTLTATCSFQVTVNAQPQGADLAVTKTDNQTSYTPGQLLVYSITVTNNGPSNVDNATISDNLPNALQNVNWTCQITAPGTGPGTSACGRANGTGDISTTVSLKSGGVASFNVRARVSESASGNLVNTVRVTNPPGVPDPNPGNNSATDTDTKFNGTPPPPGPVGPGIPLPGWSVLIYPVYTSSAANPGTENTRINLTNTSTSQNACVHMFFIDGSNCSVADSYVCLTPNQTTSFLMSDLDPGVMGYIVAVAVDCETGCPTKFNNLIGDEYVKFANGFSGNLKAECITAIAPPSCEASASAAVLNLDGVEYSQVPRVLAADNLASPRDDNSHLLVLDRVGGNLGTGAGSLGAVFGLLYDDSESAFSFSFNVGSCQLKQVLSNNFPRTTPRLDTVIASGRTGWMKLWPTAEVGVVGAIFNFNPNTSSSSSAYNGGHSLHALRLQPATSFTIPVFPPSC
ncbi:MAG: SdrD B-like domain-containing protein, partial [Blastocatellia bacterium]